MRPFLQEQSRLFPTTTLSITSKIDDLTAGEAIIKNWKEAGLVKPSAFKSVIFTVEKQYVDKTIGELTKTDREILLDCLKQILEIP